ncbi:general stress protein CsbD [Mycobacterium marseillense]|uniref:CsbD family protein n=1 Tax=Mycobacterium marseillense TaxID=701042 RepID=A0AAC9VUH9_9MYCO|nr:general stress protein CsbD [Mycobacterium marseillense]ASW90438.1 CsbD family protein [Mycobacterium marseillense]MCA2263281.1 CsbD family protein [Mycobacterium marseillense]MCV7403103.1 CsbD family protein [Mycobacterium marseillense]OBJ72800.1 general stress protein CsbD [Mycobacterium marseillense]ORA94470.1 CsbD family protein [Mycobacterium marseillense]
MSEQNKAREARRGLIDAVKGKAKEVVGAITGKDSLTAEGQLEQTQAHARKEANATEAVAEAQADQARDDATEAKVKGAQQRLAANSHAVAEEDSIEAQRSARKRATEQAARQTAAAEQTRAELDAQNQVQRAKADEREEIGSATEEVVDAVAQHQTSVQVAANEKAEADRLRQQARNATDEGDLP